MRMVLIDSRANECRDIHHINADIIPRGSFTQYVIDLDDVFKSQKVIVPSWITIWVPDRSPWFMTGAVQLQKEPVVKAVLPEYEAWCRAGLTFAKSQFKGALEQDYHEARTSVDYWISGGKKHTGKQWIKDKVDDLPMMILRQWPFWQTEEFKAYQKRNKLTDWGARRQTIIEAGYGLVVDENRLKVTCGRIGLSASQG